MDYEESFSGENAPAEDKKSKNYKPLLLIPLVLFLAAVGVYLLFFWQSTKTFPTQEAYQASGGLLPLGIPETASDCRFAIRKTTLSKTLLYSFVLDGEELEKYIAALDEEFNITGNDSSYGKWYGKKAADCIDPDYPLDDFPLHQPFETVIDEPVGEYTVILYVPSGTGTRSFGVLADEGTDRVVVYYLMTAR